MKALQTIYMPLLDEGTVVWTPVKGECLPDGRYRILGPRPDDQKWRFEPGCTVSVEEKHFSDGWYGLAAVAISEGM